MPRFSILDLAPITIGGSARQALHNARDLARHAEAWGFERFWLAEHHNMPGIASSAHNSLVVDGTNAGVLIAPGRRFTFRVRAANALGEGPWSAVVVAQTGALPDTPAAPVIGPGVEGLSPETSLQIVWVAPGTAMDTSPSNSASASNRERLWST